MFLLFNFRHYTVRDCFIKVMTISVSQYKTLGHITAMGAWEYVLKIVKAFLKIKKKRNI